MQLLVGFSSAKKWHWTTWLVKLVEGTPFSHVYIRVIDGDSDAVCNIAPDEKQFLPYNEFISYNNIIREFPLTFNQSHLNEILPKLKPNSLPYNFGKIISIGISRLLGKHAIRLSKYLWNRHKGIICTELTVAVLLAAGYSIDIDLHKSGPKKIFEVLSNIQGL